MTVRTVRAYGMYADGPEEVEYYQFSVLATGHSVEYVLKREVEGDGTFGAERLAQSARILTELYGPLTTADHWLAVGMYRFDFLMAFGGPSYDTIEAARAGERAFCEYAIEYAAELDEEGLEPEPWVDGGPATVR